MGKLIYHRRDNRDLVPWRLAVSARDQQRNRDEYTSGDHIQRQSTIPGVRLDVDTRNAAASTYRSANDSLLEILRTNFVCEYDRNCSVGSYLARRQLTNALSHVVECDRARRSIHSAGYILSQAFADGSLLQSDYIEAIDERGLGIRRKYKGRSHEYLRGHGGDGVAFHAQAVHGAVSGPDAGAGAGHAAVSLSRNPGSRSGNLHGMPRVRARMPDRLHRDRSRQGSANAADAAVAIRHRHRKVHVLRALQRTVPDWIDPSYDGIRRRRLFAGEFDSPLRQGSGDGVQAQKGA